MIQVHLADFLYLWMPAKLLYDCPAPRLQPIDRRQIMAGQAQPCHAGTHFSSSILQQLNWFDRSWRGSGSKSHSSSQVLCT